MHLLRFDSEDAWVHTLAALLGQRLRQNPELRLCLPAGNTPLPLYAALVAAVRRGELSFGRAEIFSLDEYGGLPAGDPGLCVSVLRRHLIDHIDLPAARFHFLDTTQPADALERACEEYEARIGRGLHLTLLGIGRNGHLGLNEPGSAASSLTRRVALHPESTAASASYVHSGALPTWGVTIGLNQLQKSAEVWLLASGASKAAIVERLVQGPPDVAVPATCMQAHPSCWLWLDPAAAARL